MDILFSLEPRFEDQGTILFDEMEEVSEVIFILEGQYDIGYTINRSYKYKMRFNRVDIIGAYGATFNKRSLFIIKATEKIQGYFIRKKNWIKVIRNPVNTEMCSIMQEKIKKDYEELFLPLMKAYKQKDISKLHNRCDYDNILQVTNINRSPLPNNKN
jgi:hypothetical protein